MNFSAKTKTFFFVVLQIYFATTQQIIIRKIPIGQKEFIHQGKQQQQLNHQSIDWLSGNNQSFMSLIEN